MEVHELLWTSIIKPGVQRSERRSNRLVQMILPEEQSERAIPSLQTQSPQHLDRISDISPAELQRIGSGLDQEKLPM